MALKKSLENHFIIIGTAKSGSSTLYEYFNEHPDTNLSNIKEHNFFMDIGYDWNSGVLKKLKRKIIFTLGFYNSLIKNKIISRYIEVCKNQKEFFSGDGSINYFYSKEVPKRVKVYAPNSKLILLLRNPIDRLYSNYWMITKQNIIGWEFESFDDFIKSEAYKDEINLYSISIKRWLKYFNIEDILIIESSTFFNKTKETLFEIENFLGIKNHKYSKKYFVTPFQSKANNYPKMIDSTRNKLIVYFKPYVKELELITNKNFNWKDFA